MKAERNRIVQAGQEAHGVSSLALAQLSSHLWEAANILRGPLDATDFKTYIFPLLVFKRISDVCLARVAWPDQGVR